MILVKWILTGQKYGQKSVYGPPGVCGSTRYAEVHVHNRTNTSQLDRRLFLSKQLKILAKLQNTGPLLTMHQTSRLVCCYMKINSSSFYYPLPIVPNEPLNIWTQHLTPNNFIHCRAQRDAKYMSPTLNAHTIILRFFIHCRAKRAAKYMNSTLNATQIFPLRRRQTSRLVWWIKVALHSVVVLLFLLICLQTVDLSFNLLSNWPLVLIETTFDRINLIPTGHTKKTNFQIC